ASGRIQHRAHTDAAYGCEDPAEDSAEGSADKTLDEFAEPAASLLAREAGEQFKDADRHADKEAEANPDEHEDDAAEETAQAFCGPVIREQAQAAACRASDQAKRHCRCDPTENRHELRRTEIPQ